MKELHQRLVDLAGNSGALAIEIGGAILVLALAVFALRWQFSENAKRQRTIHRRFKSLANAHKLVNGDRILLLEFSRQIGLEEPSMLFVRRQLFETGSAKVACDPNQVDALRKELFY